ncbi:hypothetical protein INT46_006885 [Mucor plumbeus]|uniref:Uncharacterized protein n=1 Tax=Mucor plumbeus TaxID=97098 RepID=A0A8H7QE64_9FUNG|nr:hypothetical protein INT46_006885 [Mucor plumbeus]
MKNRARVTNNASNNRKGYLSVPLSILTDYKKKFLPTATLSAGGRPSFVSVSTQQYIARMLRNGRQGGSKAIQEYIRLLIKVDSSAGMAQKQPASNGKPVEPAGIF